MARITPAQSQMVDLEQLQDYEPYVVTLQRIGWAESAAQYGGERRLQLDWEFDDGSTVRDWVALRLGKQQNGQVSKLRALLNALSDRPEPTEVAWFDDETLEWSYGGDQPDNKLVEGMQVVIRGKRVVKEDGTYRWAVQAYASVRLSRRRQSSTQQPVQRKPQIRPVSESEDEDEEVPF